MRFFSWIVSVAAIGALIWSLLLQTSVKQLTVQQDELRNTVGRQDSVIDRLREVVTLLKDTDTKTVMLRSGMDSKIGAAAYYNAARQVLMIDLGGIPAPPSAQHTSYCWAKVGKQYINLGALPQTAVASMVVLPFVPGLEVLQVSVETSTEGRDVPSMVILSSEGSYF